MLLIRIQPLVGVELGQAEERREQGDHQQDNLSKPDDELPVGRVRREAIHETHPNAHALLGDIREAREASGDALAPKQVPHGPAFLARYRTEPAHLMYTNPISRVTKTWNSKVLFREIKTQEHYTN